MKKYLKYLLETKPLLVTLGLLIIIIIVFISSNLAIPSNSNAPFIKTSEVSNQPTTGTNTAPINSIEQLQPGVTSISQVGSLFGDIITTSSVDSLGTFSSYVGSNKYFPIKVYTDQNNVITTVIKPVNNFESTAYDTFVVSNNLGTPDLDLFLIGDYMVKASVFLSKGIVIEHPAYSGEINNIVYFKSMSADEFTQLYASRYSFTYKHTGN